MKIKITLIAFFASALILSSCMKNEVSPGIESVRTAYAALLNAQATATITLANADAAFRNAEAAYQNALAALKLAEAQGELAAAEAIRAELAANIKVWALELQDQTRLYNIAMDAYNKAVRDAKNALVTEYFTKYSAALDSVRTIQAAIFAKNAQILALAIDVAAGTTNGMPALVADLATKTAALATLNAQLTAAKALLGTPDALVTSQTGLKNDTTTLQAAINKLLIDQQVFFPDWQAAQTAYNSASSTYAAKDAAWVAAKFNLTKVDSLFHVNYPDPDFWVAAIAKVTATKFSYDSICTDTLTAYTLKKNATDTIALGTTDITTKLTAANDSLAKYADTLAVKRADSIAKGLAEVASRAALAAILADSTAKVAQLAIVTDTANVRWVRWHAETPSAQGTIDSTLYMNAKNDSTLIRAQLYIIHATSMPAAIADTIVKLAAEVVATNAYNTWKTTKYDVIVPITTARKVVLTADLTTRTARIAFLTAALPDRTSDLLYKKTLVAPFKAAWDAALAAKEALRPNYETYMTTFYASYTASLQAAIDAAYAARTTASDAKTAAATALTTAKAPWTAVGTQITAKQAEKAVKVALLAVYANAISYNTDVVAGIKALIATKEAEIVTANTAIETAKTAYKAGKVNYDNFQIELTSLNAQLTAANANVAFWKKLLDAAIAAG